MSRLKRVALSLLLATAGAQATELKHWPGDVAQKLNTMIAANAHQGAYAVFDMDDLDLELTPYLMNPMTWYEGKLGSIVGWIDQWKKPVLVGGDTPISDGYMRLNSTDVEKGGVRVWVNRKTKYMPAMQSWWEESAKRQQTLGQVVTADKNWLVVKPEDIQ